MPIPRILCTDDDPDTREMISLLLTTEGFEVICVGSSEEAIECARTQTFNLFLLDNWMPGITGTQLCAAIRKFDAKTPILFYSGAAYQNDKESAFAAGAQGYLVKPADSAELVAKIAQLISAAKTLDPIPTAITPRDVDSGAL
ncbi:MAG: two-component system, OmpR family, response regulator [Blastocatellia bacterium]|nr:two-component system, OmpR family, response regulator [Blastocatellia bacterium]